MNESAFDQLVAEVCDPPAGTDIVGLWLDAEESDFLRFNHAAVRQATHVRQAYATVAVIAGQRRASAVCSLTGDLAADAARLRTERDALAAQLPWVPEDPYLLLPEVPTSSRREALGVLPSPDAVIAAVRRHAADLDLVGFHAGGPVVRACGDSRGQRHWHRADSFHFEWSLYREADLAVKTAVAGAHWNEDAFAATMQAARERLALLARPRRTLQPGAYRAFFSPSAVADLLATLSWGGFSERGVRTGVSSLTQLHQGRRQFHPGVHLAEDTAGGLAPAFYDAGFRKPPRVPLVEAGRAAGTLASPRTAREYGTVPNCSNMERPDALVLAPGRLARADALRALDTGVWVSDLHYLNYSDRTACRMTGMTRFACFWVEGGELVAPIAVMRFDDSLLRMFGEGLLGLTDGVEVFPENATYGARQLRTITCPGALVDGFVFAL